MLVLSRQRDQSVMIGDDIEVRLVDVRGDKVRLGFVAPDHVIIHRTEVYNEIKQENRAAAGLSADDVADVVGRPEAQPATDHHAFMQAAIAEARAGLAVGGLPIGSVLVRNGQIIGRGHNRRVQQGDPMAHAEIDCLRHAGRQATYGDTTLYSTLMPCFLCSGAVVQFGIPRVVVGESVTFSGVCAHGASPDFLRSHRVQVIDLHDAECIAMMTDFIRDNPALWNEDIGK